MNQSAQLIVTLIIDAPLVIGVASPPNAAVGVPYSYQFTASGGVLPLVWSAVGALPAGLTLSPTGLLSGTPTLAGTFALTIRATDSGV